MQLILDDNIDVERNMSTIEQESLSEKFITKKVIDHLPDDSSTGNKENIQKQENIILDEEADSNIDVDKETLSIDEEVLTNNLEIQKSNADTIETVDVQTAENVTEENLKHSPEQLSDNVVIENVINEETVKKENEEKFAESNNIEEEMETDPVILDKNSIVEDNVIIKKNDIAEISTEVDEDNELELDKEVDISELSSELNEEKQMDLEKEENNAELFTETNKDNDTEMDTNGDLTTEKELEKETAQNEVTDIKLENKTQKADCNEAESVHVTETKEKNSAIEIDDEDEKTIVRRPSINSVQTPSDENDIELQENMDKSNATEAVKEIDNSIPKNANTKKDSEESAQPKRICRLSNNLDIFSDDEDEQPDEEPSKENIQLLTEKHCINIDDDDDIMLIDEDSGTKDSENSATKDSESKDSILKVSDTNFVSNEQSTPEDTNQPKNEIDACIESKQITETVDKTIAPSETDKKEVIPPSSRTPEVTVDDTNNTVVDKPEEKEKIKPPLLPKSFINTCKKNLSDMTRNDLEEFCILKIVESIVDRSNLGEIKTHLKNLTQTMEECKKKCLMLSKQNKDLQVVLKSVQEEQKSGSDVHITPLKITRSVGMQVVMVADKSNPRKKPINGVGSQGPVSNNNNTKQVKSQQIQNTRNQKEKPPMNQQIPVPRLVPATSPVVKTNQTTVTATNTKQVSNTNLPNGVRNSPPVQKVAEKRTRSQAVTVDLTDDEPPPKLQNVQRSTVNQQMRVLTTGPNLVPAQRFNQSMNSPRKVYIPISGPQAQNVRPGQTIMLKTLSGLGPRPRAQAQALITKTSPAPSAIRFGRNQANRHPAPLPDAMKQYQPPNWKSLPPAPDLKLSKVENGIVISWKIDGYQQDNHEEIASYQLYAYQETTLPPNTNLWKKIGDVKALPLPMACTLTQFMAGFKYYFAVRAVDIRSRFGPFSLPGSILLLNKM